MTDRIPGQDDEDLAELDDTIVSAAEHLAAAADYLVDVTEPYRFWRRSTSRLPADLTPDATGTHAAISSEIADVLAYLTPLVDACDVDLTVAVVDKFNQVSARYGFPDRLTIQERTAR